mmetsp:Transcript_19739/g.27118  ORF Transcript_19739/g.27118 Transcript_19739/m.27118 type:complete len:377 (-) Transcript_19739:8309-9439(-)
MGEDWKITLKNALSIFNPIVDGSNSPGNEGELEGVHCTEIDYSSSVTILCGLFKDVIFPSLIPRNNDLEISLPEHFSIVLGESCLNFTRILHVLQYEVLSQSPFSFQKSLLDLLYLILRKDLYAVVRFKFSIEHHNILFQKSEKKVDTVNNVPGLANGSVSKSSYGLTHTLLVLLQSYRCSMRPPLSVTKRIIHLLGTVCEAGISVPDLKFFLSLLKNRSELSVSLLQSLKTMIRQDNGISKAALSAYFDFGGKGAGLFVKYSSVAPISSYNFSNTAPNFPFLREYEICTWFRIENFAQSSESEVPSVTTPGSRSPFRRSSTENSASFHTPDTAQHIIKCISASTRRGIDVFIDKKSSYHQDKQPGERRPFYTSIR